MVEKTHGVLKLYCARLKWLWNTGIKSFFFLLSHFIHTPSYQEQTNPAITRKLSLLSPTTNKKWEKKYPSFLRIMIWSTSGNDDTTYKCVRIFNWRSVSHLRHLILKGQRLGHSKFVSSKTASIKHEFKLQPSSRVKERESSTKKLNQHCKKTWNENYDSKKSTQSSIV